MPHSHTRDLVELRTKRLHILEKRQATFGLSTPPEIEIEIEQIREEIGKLVEQLDRDVIRVTVLETERPPFSPGLMLLVSPAHIERPAFDQAALDAIAYHQPCLRHCWLIGSGGERGSLSVARDLRRTCEGKGIHAHVWHVEDAVSVQETYTLVDWLYAYDVPTCGLSEHEVIADITGATKPMSFGMLLACGTRRPMQYMVWQAKGQPSIPLRLSYSLSGDVPGCPGESR